MIVSSETIDFTIILQILIIWRLCLMPWSWALYEQLPMLVSYSVVVMPEITEQAIFCPYCGESISILVDDSASDQRYIEDCQVCCRPMIISVSVGPDGDVSVDARSENE